jgi:hypothetical protein
VRTQLCCEPRKLLECGEPVGVELPLSDHVCGLDPSQWCIGRVEGLEAKHRARDPFNETVVLFDDVVQVALESGKVRSAATFGSQHTELN